MQGSRALGDIEKPEEEIVDVVEGSEGGDLKELCSAPSNASDGKGKRDVGDDDGEDEEESERSLPVLSGDDMIAWCTL